MHNRKVEPGKQKFWQAVYVFYGEKQRSVYLGGSLWIQSVYCLQYLFYYYGIILLISASKISWNYFDHACYIFFAHVFKAAFLVILKPLYASTTHCCLH